MSLLLNQPSMLCLGKPLLVRSSPLGCNGSSSSLPQTRPCFIMDLNPLDCPPGFGKLYIRIANNKATLAEKKVSMEFVGRSDYVSLGKLGTIGSSHGWVATMKDGRVRLQDDLNPVASESNPKRISMPPLVTLPYCQTQIVTNMSMSSSSPEEEDCVVAIKFMGQQLSLCRPAQSKSEWTNIRIKNPCFFSSPVMFSQREGMFRIPGAGGHLIGSWDLGHNPEQDPKIQTLRFPNLPELTMSQRKILHSCCTREHLVESPTTGETFLVKWYRKSTQIWLGRPILKTEAVMVFKLDQEGNAVYTEDIGDLVIFLSKAEPFCVPASSFPGVRPNIVEILDVDESATVNLANGTICSENLEFSAPYWIPPQNIEL